MSEFIEWLNENEYTKNIAELVADIHYKLVPRPKSFEYICGNTLSA